MSDQPITQPTAPADASAPPNTSAPTSIPGAALPPTSQQVSQPSITGTQEFQGAVSGENQALQNAAKLAQPDAPTPPVPHARLLSMIQGLSIGLSAAATSLGTKGREGGAPEVANFYQQQQQEKIQAQQAAAAQKNAKIQQQLMVADTNHKLGQNILLLGTLPNQLAQSDLALAKGKTELAGEQQGQAITKADFQASHGGMDPEQFSSVLSGNTPAGAPAGASTFITNNAQQQLGAATKVLGDKDPYIQKVQTLLSMPNAAPKDLWTATSQLQTQVKLQDDATNAQIKKEAAQAGSRAKDLNDASGRLAQAEDAFKATPTAAAKAAVDSAKADQTVFLSADRQQKQIAQDIQNGDPNVIGSAMAAGVYAPSQVLSARSMSKPFYAKVVAAADKQAQQDGTPEILGPNGQHTGHYFNAATAEAQYKYASNVQTQNTLNKILTLNEPGGDIDILKNAAAALPGMDERTANRIFNATATEFGSPEESNYHLAALNLAGLMAQVQTGGVPSEGEIQEQLNALHSSSSKGQLAGAADIMGRDIGARGRSLVNGNPYLRASYPNLLAGGGAGANAAASSGKSVSLKSAMALPVNAGKTEAQVRADIQAHGHAVGE